ncbi:MAG: sodium:solute symporter family protein [Lachnospiraceae bacterium]|nr:sodium:solute symporter family protein [Lachnospiraceae bacterium]
MSTNTGALIILIIYFIGLFVLAAIANNMQKKRAAQLHTEGAEGYLMASRSMGIGTIMTTIMGVAIGANATTGAAQGGYSYGLAAGTHPFWLGLGVVITGIFFVNKYRNTGMATIPGLFVDAYGGNTGVVNAIGQIFMQFVIMVSQFIAGGSILHTLLPQYFTTTMGMIVSAIIFLLIAIFGGWMSCGVTNILNMIVCYLAVALALVAVFTNPDVGGLVGIREALGDKASTYFSPIAGIGWGVWFAYPVMMITNVATGQSQVQCITTAKDAKTAKISFIVGGLLVAPIGYCCALIGMAAYKLNPSLQSTADAMPSVLLTLPTVAAGIAVAGMWACYVSTATNLSIASATVAVKDIIKPLRAKSGKDLTPKQESTLGAVIIIAFTAVACFCSFFVKSLLNFARAGLGICIPFFFIMMITLFFPKLARKRTAVAITIPSYIVMILVTISPKIKAFFFGDAIWALTIVGLIAAVLVTIIDKEPAFFQTKEFYKIKPSLYLPGTPDYEKDPFREK